MSFPNMYVMVGIEIDFHSPLNLFVGRYISVKTTDLDFIYLQINNFEVPM